MGQEITGRPLEILLVEDNPGDVRLTTEMLKQAKLLNRLTVAVDGEQALAMLQRTEAYSHQPLPDLILLDLNLPGLDGRELLERIKEDPNLARIPVVVLTQSGADTDVRRAYDAYASCYVRKPLDLDQFLGVMQSIGHFWLSVVTLPAGVAGRPDALPVLLVEDEAGDARLVVELLREVEPRYVLDTVASLAAALDAVQRQRYVAVLLDLGLPDSQGLQTVRALLQTAGHVPLVVLSGRDDENLALRAIQLGAQDYVVKGRGDGGHLSRALRYAIERKLVQEHLEFVASHDGTTGLPNRRRFLESLQQLLPSMRRRGGEVAVVALTLTGLNAVNQSLGHDIGDLALKAAVGRMQRLMPEGTLLACTGSSEFALACSEGDAIGQAALLAEQLLDALRQPYRVAEHEFFLGGQIGMSLSPNDASDAAPLLKCAETAMYQAGQRGVSGIDFYSPELNRTLQERLILERELRHALLRDELDLDFQPIVDGRGRVVSAEALLRWNHPERGRIAPDRFLALAEQSDLILSLGRWVMNRATRIAQSWSELLPDPPSVAINVSARQLDDGRVLVDLGEALAQSGLSAQRVELELTESVMQRPESRETLTTLRELGISIAIDDFGTGFSSLSYLKAFPVDLLKIDRSFVTDATTDSRDAVIVRAIIAMSHILGIDVVAEGVETERHEVVLRALGCNRLQGFHIGRPESPDRFADRLRRQARGEAPLPSEDDMHE
ncbi:MAG TPA: EAL domain-containing protein [Tahibacter sp.]|uniref:putative bifunctional diguanylate cyclase/phosphodiesterase n=1 Tax=Tahibacter sp. TaxID=2056211 RepID=UPI002B84D408|nr:EAL domain-containing protein [Tahibacter sp.]HSX61870.1 EAL domain-containing protein [Tahibacter sp.]